jgi:hypothetical protein
MPPQISRRPHGHRCGRARSGWWDFHRGLNAHAHLITLRQWASSAPSTASKPPSSGCQLVITTTAPAPKAGGAQGGHRSRRACVSDVLN